MERPSTPSEVNEEQGPYPYKLFSLIHGEYWQIATNGRHRKSMWWSYNHLVPQNVVDVVLWSDGDLQHI